MSYVLGKRILNIFNHVIFPAKIQIQCIDVSVFMFDLSMIDMSSECEYDWYWKISACSTEYEACDSYASLTRHQASYSGSAGWYFRYQSIYIRITYTGTYFDLEIHVLTSGKHSFISAIDGISRVLPQLHSPKFQQISLKFHKIS